jgi:ribosome-binding factor A
MAHRLLKVNEAIREALSHAIAEGLKDPRVGFVTVTGVKTSSDLRHAKVYVSVLGTSRERETTLAGLRSSHGYLQDRVAATVRLKRTPQLEFLYDDSIDRGMRIERLIQKHQGELGEEPPPEVGGESDGTDPVDGATPADAGGDA